MFRGHHKRIQLLLGIADVVLIAIAFTLAYQSRVRLELQHNFYLLRGEATALLVWSMAVWLGIAAWWELYDRIDTAHPKVILRRTFQQCLVGAASVVVFEYMLRMDLSRSFLAMFGLYTWFLLCLFRLNAARIVGVMRRGFGGRHYVMVVGVGDAAKRIGMQLEEASPDGVRLIGFLENGEVPDTLELGAIYPVHRLDALTTLLRQHVIDEIVFAIDSRRLADLEDVFLLCDEQGVRTRVAVDFFPHVNSRVYLDRLGTYPLLTFSATPHDDIRLLVKRVTDLLLAAVALVLLFVPMLAIALLVRLTSRGPVIFRQERCGLNGRRFTFYKFRSMCENAEALRASVAHLTERETAWKIPNDPRLTGVGRWLRKFSVDEWPQLWNVLRGDMSLVGPRPAVPEEVEQYLGWQRRRLRMRPGLTCLWAVSGRDAVDFETWMRLDMQYIDNWSLALDWNIILRTIPQVLMGRGAH